MTEYEELHIYTDGSCKVHTSKAGSYGFVVINPNTNEIIVEGSKLVKPPTTSPKMELMGIIAGIKKARNLKSTSLVVLSDNEVAIKGITEWMPAWKTRGWKTSAGTSVQNKHLWKELDMITEGMNIYFKWVKGHDGNEWNEYAHSLADKAMLKWK